MSERRRFFRFLKQRKAQYFSEEKIRNWQECTVLDFSRKGMRLSFRDRMTVGSKVSLEVPIPGESVPVNVNGTVRWVEEKGDEFIGGIELTGLLDDDKLSKLMLGYGVSQKKIATRIVKDVVQDLNVPADETSPAVSLNYHDRLSSFRSAVSIKRVSLMLAFVALLFSLPLLFFFTGSYFSKSLLSEKVQDEVVVAQFKEVPTSIKPAKAVPEPFISSADASLVSRTGLIDTEIIDSGEQPFPEKEEGKNTQEASPGLESPGAVTDQFVASTDVEPKNIGTVKLKEEGSLYAIAIKSYQKANETLYDLIITANPAITNVRKISDDTDIVLPVITEESFIRESGDSQYQIHMGTFDTLKGAILCSREALHLGSLISIERCRFSPYDMWYRVTLGSFKNKEDALKKVEALKEQAIIYIPPPISS